MHVPTFLQPDAHTYIHVQKPEVHTQGDQLRTYNTYAHTHSCLLTCMNKPTLTHECNGFPQMYIHVYTHTCIFLFIYIYICIIYIYKYICIYIYKCLYTATHACGHTNTYVFTCTHACTHKFRSSCASTSIYGIIQVDIHMIYTTCTYART